MKTATATSATLKVPKSASTDLRAWRRGVDLALDLLDKANDPNEMSLDNDCRNGRPQSNPVLGCLQQLRKVNDVRADVGFAAVLSDFIASSQGGVVPGMTCLRKLSRKPIGGPGVP